MSRYFQPQLLLAITLAMLASFCHAATFSLKDATVADLMTWVADYTGMPAPKEPPLIIPVAPKFFFSNVCLGATQCGDFAWVPGPADADKFHVTTYAIYFDQELDPETDPYATALLVHELVHYVQRTSGLFGDALFTDCTKHIEAEREAVLTQEAWLHQHGFGFNAAAMMRRYKCAAGE